MSFNGHVQHVKDMCLQTQRDQDNITQVVENHNKTFVIVYRALIGSIIEYAAFISPTLSLSLTKYLQVIQNKAMRVTLFLTYLVFLGSVTD